MCYLKDWQKIEETNKATNRTREICIIGVIRQYNQSTSGLTTINLKLIVGLQPVQLHAVEADQVLQVHEDNRQRVELVGQPEISKAHSVEWRSDHSELRGTGER